MGLTVENICKRAMRMAGRGDKPSVDDFNDALETLDMIFKTWSANYGVAFWDIICNTFNFTAGELALVSGKVYQCIWPHTSTADDEPGVGDNWETYWKETTDLTTTDIWVSGIPYSSYRSLDFGDPKVHSINNLHINYQNDFYPVELVAPGEMFDHSSLEVGMPDKAYIQQSQFGPTVILGSIPDKDYEFKHYSCNKPESIDKAGLGGAVAVPDNWLIAATYALAVELGYLYSIDIETIGQLIRKAKYEFKKCKGTDKGEVDRCFVEPTY